MKKKFLLMTLMSAAFLLGAQDAPAQNGIDAFWSKFRAAVIAKDKKAVAALSRLPIEMPFGQKAVRTSGDLMRRYGQIFDGEADAAQCFATAKPENVTARRFEIYCGFKNSPDNPDKPIGYYFEKTKTGWRFVALDNINE